MGNAMNDNEKTREPLVHELSELRSQNAELKKSITEITSAEVVVEEARRYAESILETVREPLLVLDAGLKIISANRNFYTTFKVTPGETIGSLIYDLGNKQWDIPDLRKLLEEVLPEKQAFDDFEVDHIFQDIGHKIMLLNACRILRKDIRANLILLAIEDVTERKRLENSLIDSELQYRRLFETASDGIVLLEKSEGKITHANPATEKMLGYNQKDIIGSKLPDIGVSLDMEDFQTTMQNLNKSGIINYRNVSVDTKSGQHIDTEIYLVDRAKLVQCNIRNITERRREVEVLRATEKNYHWVLNNMADVITVMDMNLRFTYVSPSIIRMRGYTVEEAVAQTLEQVMTPESLQISARVFEEEMKLEASGTADPDRIRIVVVEQYRKDGSIVLMENHLSFMRDEAKKPVGIISVSHDITQRRRAEEALIKAKTLLDKTFASMDEAIFIVDPDTRRITACNHATEVIFGFGEKDLIGCGTDVLHVDKVSYDLFGQELFPALEANGVFRTEFQMRRKDGSIFPTENTVTEILDDSGRRTGVVSVVRDITERKHSEKLLLESSEILSNALEMAHLGHWEYDVANDLFTFNDQFYKIFRTTAEQVGGYTMRSTEYAHRFVHPDDIDAVGEETRRAIETADPHFNRQIEHRMLYADGKVGYITVRFFIVKDSNGRTIKTYGVNQDITERKKAEQKLEDTLESLRKSFGATIQVLVSAVEARDPYTAGHQIRVADLARAIATEMGLPQEQIDGIRMAGTIHDIGKLSIPAEILSKPTKLSEIEFSLIKEHARKGFEMLKDVESPWPLAEIVHQHHERMDGSGYPGKLKGEEILIEARILSVADVVEAMASHRPYRPGLGIDAALEEISKNRGILYDAGVVDACLRLFNEKGYKFD